MHGLQNRKDGKESTKARDAMKEIAPKAAAAMAAGAAPGIAVMAPGAVTTGGRMAGAAIQTSRHGEKIIKAAPQVKDFIEAATITGPPAMTKAGVAGYIAGKAYEAKKD